MDIEVNIVSEYIIGVVKVDYLGRIIYSKIDVGDGIEQRRVSLSLLHCCDIVVASFAVVLCEAGLAVAARVMKHADRAGKANNSEVIYGLYDELVRFIHYCRGEIQIKERHVYYVAYFSCEMNVCQLTVSIYGPTQISRSKKLVC